VNDRRVLNGIFWVLRSGAPWRDLPGSFGYTTCYNRFVLLGAIVSPPTWLRRSLSFAGWAFRAGSLSCSTAATAKR
jgi:transposase